MDKKQKVMVRIIRDDNSKEECFIGEVLQKGSSFLKIIHKTNKEVGEWLPINSLRIWCKPS